MTQKHQFVPILGVTPVEQKKNFFCVSRPWGPLPCIKNWGVKSDAFKSYYTYGHFFRKNVKSFGQKSDFLLDFRGHPGRIEKNLKRKSCRSDPNWGDPYHFGTCLRAQSGQHYVFSEKKNILKQNLHFRKLRFFRFWHFGRPRVSKRVRIYPRDLWDTLIGGSSKLF